MPDLPEEAVQAAARAMDDEHGLLREWNSEAFAYAALEAAAPVLAAHVRRDAALALRAVAETREFRRRFIDRHPELHEGVTVCAVLLAVANEIEGEARDSR